MYALFVLMYKIVDCSNVHSLVVLALFKLSILDIYCYTISSFYYLLPASYICRSTLQPVSLSQSSKRITAATFRECFTVNRIVFYVVRENLIHVVNFGVYHKIYKIFTLKILNIHPIWGSNPGPLD